MAKLGISTTLARTTVTFLCIVFAFSLFYPSLPTKPPHPSFDQRGRSIDSFIHLSFLFIYLFFLFIFIYFSFLYIVFFDFIFVFFRPYKREQTFMPFRSTSTTTHPTQEEPIHHKWHRQEQSVAYTHGESSRSLSGSGHHVPLRSFLQT